MPAIKQINLRFNDNEDDDFLWDWYHALGKTVNRQEAIKAAWRRGISGETPEQENAVIEAQLLELATKADIRAILEASLAQIQVVVADGVGGDEDEDFVDGLKELMLR